MKRVLSLLLAVLLCLCLCLSGCSGSSLAIPEIYTKIAPSYISRIGEMTIDEAKSIAEDNGLKFQEYTSGSYRISNSGKWNAIVYFESTRIHAILFQNWENNSSFIISETEIEYNCFKNGKERIVKKFASISDCEKFIFGETSGIDFTVKKEAPSSSSSLSSSSNSSSSSSLSISLRYGKLLDKKITGTSLIIKAKIEPSYNNKATVDQNYYNIENIVKNQGGSKFNEIQYWAVADMTDGSEQKVISFTVPEDVIQKIANDKIVANQIGNHVDDLFIHASLR